MNKNESATSHGFSLQCVFSALIHDVGHTGVPNSRLAVEEPNMATFYDNKSIAEQNSVNQSFELLMQPRYEELRAAIYSTELEKNRFRQYVPRCPMYKIQLTNSRFEHVARLVVNSVRNRSFGMWGLFSRSRFLQVMATDIMDKDLKQLRNNRWAKAFSESANETDIQVDTNRKATIVIEHLIQASDVVRMT